MTYPSLWAPMREHRRRIAGSPVATYLPPELLTALRALTERRQVTAAALIRALVQQEVDFARESGELGGVL